MSALEVVPALALLLVGLGVCAGWSVITQTRHARPEAPGSGDGGGGGGGLGPVEDAPAGGGGVSLGLQSSWALQDDVDVFLLLQREDAH